MKSKEECLLEISGLKKYYRVKSKEVLKAVDDISFSIKRGEILGLVGESGSGKSTVGKCLIQIIKPSEGEIWYKGIDICNPKLKRSEKAVIKKGIKIVFQDPVSSMNPRMTVREIIEEPMIIQKLYKTKEERMKLTIELLETVGLLGNLHDRYVSELSGGQNQRVCIARSLVGNPDFIIADEPVASLDVLVRWKMVELFQYLQKEKGLTCLFITHDLRTARQICDRIGVMYQGKLVELAETEKIYKNPMHLYTKSLISAIPTLNPIREIKRISYVKEMDTTKVWNEIEAGHFVLR